MSRLACPLCKPKARATIVEAHALAENGHTRPMDPRRLTHGLMGPNLFAQGGVFLLKKA